jgi:hypothetical protein
MRFASLGGRHFDRLNNGDCFAYAIAVESRRKNAAERKRHPLNGTGGMFKTAARWGCRNEGRELPAVGSPGLDARQHALMRSLNRYASARSTGPTCRTPDR